MNTTTRCSLSVAAALVAAVGLAACSRDDGIEPAPALTATPPPTSTAAADPTLAGLVGPGCAAYRDQAPRGTGSFAAMAEVPLVTAARTNPQLKELTKAVSGKLNSKVKLGATLNGGEYTLFAPVNAAFAALPAATRAELKSDRRVLTSVLTYHLVAGQLTPKAVIGKQTTVQGAELVVTGSGAALKVGGANVICGGIRTANATVYLIDRVLTPPR